MSMRARPWRVAVIAFLRCGAAHLAVWAGAGAAAAQPAESAPRFFFAAALDEASPLGGAWASTLGAGSWLGVYCDKDFEAEAGACRLQPARIQVRDTSAPGCRGRPVPVSRLKIDPPSPLFVVSGLALQPGSLPTWLADRTGRELPGAAVSTLRAATGAGLSLNLPARRSGGGACIDVRSLAVELQQAHKPPSRWQRPICAHRPAIEGEFALHWTGDLDGDGHADLVLRYPDGTVNLLVSTHPALRLRSRPEFPLAGC